ncbi:LPS assembly lipoprotein LptE [Candidatus Omnitrophota bacterium]
MIKIRIAVLMLLLSVFVCGCGYTTRANIAKDSKNIYVEQFKNKIDLTSEQNEYRKLRTYYPLLEANITNEVIDEFLSDGNYKITREDDAEVILTGELLDYQRDALRYDDDDDVDEYRLNITVSLSLYNTEENTLEWKEDRLTGDTTYFTTGTLAKSEKTALDEAIDDLAKRIVERVVDDW